MSYFDDIIQKYMDMLNSPELPQWAPTKRALEKELIDRAMQLAEGSCTYAAPLLNVNRTMLHERFANRYWDRKR